MRRRVGGTRRDDATGDEVDTTESARDAFVGLSSFAGFELSTHLALRPGRVLGSFAASRAAVA